MNVWASVRRALGLGRDRRPVEERQPDLRFVRETQDRIRREIEDRHRAQRLEDQAALWQGEQ